MSEPVQPVLFNSPLETGVRTVVLLDAAAPAALDLTHLTWLDHLVVHTEELVFPEAVSFIYGASNTGKSFAVKAIDFMLGGRALLPDIAERRPYQRIQLDVQVGDDSPFQFERAISGGDFLQRQADGTERTLGSRHSSESDTNLSNYLLGLLGATGKEVARDKSGQKRALSFRDIVRLCIADETAIQSEASPVESGDLMLTLGERNAFKYLLTGEDDSALVAQVKRQDFNTGKSAQLRFIDEMIANIDIELAEDFPDADKLDEMKEKVEDDLAAIEKDIVAARTSVVQALERKRALTVDNGRASPAADLPNVSVEPPPGAQPIG